MTVEDAGLLGCTALGKSEGPPSTSPLPDLVRHLTRQALFSQRTFGPGARTAGVVDHIRKELREIEAKPDDLSEWIDVAILAFDGAWRAGYSAERIVSALVAKQEKNEARQWPDWRTAAPNKAIEHVRGDEAQPAASVVASEPPANCDLPLISRSGDETIEGLIAKWRQLAKDEWNGGKEWRGGAAFGRLTCAADLEVVLKARPQEDADAFVLCECGHNQDEHGHDGAGPCGATKACRAGGCREFRPKTSGDQVSNH